MWMRGSVEPVRVRVNVVSVECEGERVKPAGTGSRGSGRLGEWGEGSRRGGGGEVGEG